MEISPYIHRLELKLGARLLAQHLLTGDKVYLVDTGVQGTPTDHILPYLKSVGISYDRVAAAIITHPDADHFGGNAEVKAACPRILIMAHEKDADLIESPSRCLSQRYDFQVPYGFRLDRQIAARIMHAIRHHFPSPGTHFILGSTRTILLFLTRCASPSLPPWKLHSPSTRLPQRLSGRSAILNRYDEAK